MAAARLIIIGRVQGVGFRGWACRAAFPLNLRGWVRNRADGSVEILAIGEDAAIDELVAACRRGPRMAAVDDLQRTPAEDDGSTDFSERASA
jgi:acylphosphatase